MGAISNSERRKRLKQLAETVFTRDPPGVTRPALQAAACREWGITSRTAVEYLDVLVDSKVLYHHPPGGPLHISKAGLDWLNKNDGGMPEDPEAITIVPAPRPPSPPSVEEDAK